VVHGAAAVVARVAGWHSGKSTPYTPSYSYAQSLAARGDYEGAIAAYELEIAKAPRVPEPYLRVARLLRLQLKRYEDAVHWLRRVRREAELTTKQELMVTREIAEIYLTLIGDERGAVPELARLAERFPGSAEAGWARDRLAEIKGPLSVDDRGSAR